MICTVHGAVPTDHSGLIITILEVGSTIQDTPTGKIVQHGDLQSKKYTLAPLANKRIEYNVKFGQVPMCSPDPAKISRDIIYLLRFPRHGSEKRIDR